MTRRMRGEGSVYQRKDGLWIGAANLGYNAAGRQVRKTVSAKTKGGAIKRLKEIQKPIDANEPLPDERLTVGKLIELWLPVVEHRVRSLAFTNYRDIARIHIVPELGRKRVVKLTALDVDRLLVAKRDAGLSTSTVRRIRLVLSMAIDQAVKWNAVNRNVVKFSTSPAVKYREGRSLSPSEVQVLVKHLKGVQFEAVYLTILALGLRRGEVLGLRWEDINFDESTLTINQTIQRVQGSLVAGQVKTTKSRRTLTLAPDLVKVLKVRKAEQNEDRLKAGASWIDSGLVFTTGKGTALDPRNVYRPWVKCVESANLGRLTLHDLRHTAASLMMLNRIPIESVSSTLGHSSIRTTADVYGHIALGQRKAATDAMASVMWGS
jgi:integrase